MRNAYAMSMLMGEGFNHSDNHAASKEPSPVSENENDNKENQEDGFKNNEI
jgi:hypothetical protein